MITIGPNPLARLAVPLTAGVAAAIVVSGVALVHALSGTKVELPSSDAILGGVILMLVAITVVADRSSAPRG